MRQRFAGGGSSNNSQSGDTAEESLLLPGFEPELPPPLEGFGGASGKFNVKVEERDKRYALDRFGRYDRNKDGYLTKDEISSGRWSDDPFQYDRNRDGKLSVAEMAVRYAKRRVDEEARNASRSGGTTSRTGSRFAGRNTEPQPSFFTLGTNKPASSSSSGTTSSSGSGGDNGDRMARYADFMMQRYDRNGNGKLEKDEWGGMRGDPTEYDKNKDGRIERKELMGYLATRYGGGDRSKKKEGEKSEDTRTSYRFLTAQERLEAEGLLKPLPDGFLDADKDGDGQVRMAEFSSKWDDKMVAAFTAFDKDNDGIITARECVDGIENGKIWGSSSGGSSSSSKSQYASRSKTDSSRRGGTSRRGTGGFYRSRGGADSSSRKKEEEKPKSSFPSDSPKSDDEPKDEPEESTSPPPADGDASDIPKTYLRYAVSLIQQADKNGDQMLDKQEWSAMAKDPSAADTNKDGKITPIEMARFKMNQ